MDNYGNYLCQSLIEACCPIKRFYLLKKIEEKLYLLCKDKRATHVIQIIVELQISEDEETLIINRIKGHIAELANVLFNK